MNRNIPVRLGFCLLMLAAAAPAALQGQARAVATANDDMAKGAPVRWGPAPACFPAGASMAVVGGDPSAAGQLWTARLRFPDGYVIQAHWHPTDENVTVLRGTLEFGFGDAFSESALTTYHAGGFVVAEAHRNHFVRASGETEVQVHAIGPFALIYAGDRTTTPDCPLP